jgi:hypothetical protein
MSLISAARIFSGPLRQFGTFFFRSGASAKGLLLACDIRQQPDIPSNVFSASNSKK